MLENNDENLMPYFVWVDRMSAEVDDDIAGNNSERTVKLRESLEIYGIDARADEIKNGIYTAPDGVTIAIRLNPHGTESYLSVDLHSRLLPPFGWRDPLAFPPVGVPSVFEAEQKILYNHILLARKNIEFAASFVKPPNFTVDNDWEWVNENTYPPRWEKIVAGILLALMAGIMAVVIVVLIATLF